MRLVINRQTEQQLKQLIANPSHAVLLLGPDGIGKTAISLYVSQIILSLQPTELESYPYFYHLQPEGSAISIAAVRDIQKALRLKTTGTTSIRRIICIDHADALTQEAQNALLKILEEPPADTVLILTAHHKHALLPTILSRTQIITVHAPAQQQLEQHFIEMGSNATAVQRAYFLSGGLPGLMHGMLHNKTEHPLLAQVAAAKDFLKQTTFERLASIDTLTKQKETLNPFLEALVRIASSGLMQAANRGDIKGIRQWHSIRNEVTKAQDALQRSANAKLVLTKMLLHI